LVVVQDMLMVGDLHSAADSILRCKGGEISIINRSNHLSTFLSSFVSIRLMNFSWSTSYYCSRGCSSYRLEVLIFHYIVRVIGTMVGYFTFYTCASVSAHDDRIKYEECRTEGPAIFLNVWADIIGFLLQVLLIWIAWVILPCSKVKGKPKFKYVIDEIREDEKRIQCCCCFNCFNDRYKMMIVILGEVV